MSLPFIPWILQKFTRDLHLVIALIFSKQTANVFWSNWKKRRGLSMKGKRKTQKKHNPLCKNGTQMGNWALDTPFSTVSLWNLRVLVSAICRRKRYGSLSCISLLWFWIFSWVFEKYASVDKKAPGDSYPGRGWFSTWYEMNLIPEKSGLKWQNIRLKNPSRKMSKMGEPHQEFTIMKFCKEVHHEKQRQRRSHSGSGSATRKQGRCTRATWMNWEGCGHTITMLSS